MPHDATRSMQDYIAVSHIALSVAEFGDTDDRLIAVNGAFCALTGYDAAEVQGRNCRFLQGEMRNQPQRGQIRDFLAADARDSLQVPLLNFRRDGAAFINLLFISKLRDRRRRPVFLFASQFDVTRTHGEELARYDRALTDVLEGMSPALHEHGVVVRGSLMAMANSASVMAQAHVTMTELRAHVPSLFDPAP